MPRQRRSSLAWLIWWSIRLAWARNKWSRYRFRQKIWEELIARWQSLMPEDGRSQDAMMVRAIWRGASLASRSLGRYPVLPPRVKSRLLWFSRLLGRTNGKAVASAYLAWTWLGEMALSSGMRRDLHGSSGT
ncbi:MAG: hypothetical protein OWU84_09535 [Firmicutes bacterium]|nr:hypothetical protein [Bacillota bacterium]